MKKAIKRSRLVYKKCFNLSYNDKKVVKPYTEIIGNSKESQFLCQLTCQSTDIMASLCGGHFSSKATRPRDMFF